MSFGSAGRCSRCEAKRSTVVQASLGVLPARTCAAAAKNTVGIGSAISRAAAASRSAACSCDSHGFGARSNAWVR